MNTQAESADRALADSYDRTPYAGKPYCPTHPSLLGALGHIYGLSPKSPTTCRVLELGCGDGGNLIPMAYELPGSEFMGIDLSPVQIRIGQNMVQTLALENVQLATRNLMDINPNDGKFDYIIAHGVYSWVPDEVKGKILKIFRNNLEYQGIAYISYNVLPGWQFNKSMRDLMLYRTRRIKDPRERTNAVLDLIKTMLETRTESNRFHDIQLRFFGKTLQSFDDVSSYLLHEYLETNNDSFYFHQFADNLSKHSLQYMCDADQTEFELDRLPADAAEKFEEIAKNPIEVEQYIDFFMNTRFRRSLVCHKGIDVNSDYHFKRLETLFAATNVVPILDSEDSPIKEAKAFRTAQGRQFSTEHVLAQIALHTLSEIRPCTMDVPALLKEIKIRAALELEGNELKQAEKIGHVVYNLFFNGVLELLDAPRRCILEISDRPTASPMARLMAPTGRVTNLNHRTINIDETMAGFVLAHLDGTRNREELLDLMGDAICSGRVIRSKQKEGNQAENRELLSSELESMLHNLARCGVMIA